MNNKMPILAGLAVGFALVVAAGSLGLMIAGLLMLLSVPLVVRGGLPVLSAVLTGFGALWTVLVLGQLNRGGAAADDGLRLAVGLVPLALGLTLLVVAAARRRPGPDELGVDALR
jgi:hypothetical protein